MRHGFELTRWECITVKPGKYIIVGIVLWNRSDALPIVESIRSYFRLRIMSYLRQNREYLTQSLPHGLSFSIWTAPEWWAKYNGCAILLAVQCQRKRFIPYPGLYGPFPTGAHTESMIIMFGQLSGHNHSSPPSSQNWFEKRKEGHRELVTSPAPHSTNTLQGQRVHMLPIRQIQRNPHSQLHWIECSLDWEC